MLTQQWKPKKFEFLAQTPLIITFITFLSYNYSKNVQNDDFLDQN